MDLSFLQAPVVCAQVHAPSDHSDHVQKYWLVNLWCDVYPWMGWMSLQLFVFTGEFGTRKHPLFCFMPSYWRSQQKSQDDIENLIKLGDIADGTVDIEDVRDDLASKNAVR